MFWAKSVELSRIWVCWIPEHDFLCFFPYTLLQILCGEWDLVLLPRFFLGRYLVLVKAKKKFVQPFLFDDFVILKIFFWAMSPLLFIHINLLLVSCQGIEILGHCQGTLSQVMKYAFYHEEFLRSYLSWNTFHELCPRFPWSSWIGGNSTIFHLSLNWQAKTLSYSLCLSKFSTLGHLWLVD